MPRVEAARKLKLSQSDMENHILVPVSPRTARREAGNGEKKEEEEEDGESRMFKSANGKVSNLKFCMFVCVCAYRQTHVLIIVNS